MKKLKLTRFRFAVLLMLIVITVYLAALYPRVQAYNTWKQNALKRNPDVDLLPFPLSSFGRPFVFSGVAILLCFMFVIPLIAGKNLLLMFFLGSILGVALLATPIVFATSTTHIHILCVCDEEFDDGIIWVPNPPVGAIPVPSKSWAELAAEDITEYFVTSDLKRLKLEQNNT